MYTLFIMLVTELETNSDACSDSIQTNYTVKEFNIDEEPLDDGLHKMYDYYVSEIIDDMEKESIKSRTDPNEEENESLGKEYKSESFTRTFKTLVDIVVEPHDEHLSSSDSEASEDIISTISRVSNDFITQTTSIFSSKDDTDSSRLQECTKGNKCWKLDNLAKWF